MPVSFFNTKQNERNDWYVSMLDPIATLLDDANITARHTNGYLSGLGGKLPFNATVNDGNRNFYDSSLNYIGSFGTSENITLDNSLLYVDYLGNLGWTWGGLFTYLGYTGSRIGTFYVSILSDNTGNTEAYSYFLLDPSRDYYNGGSIMFKITLTEAVNPSSFSLDYTAQTCAISVGGDGNYTLSKSGTISWITLTKSTGTNTDTLTFNVTYNGGPAGVYRSGTLLVTTPHTVFSIFVEQYPK